MNLNQNPTIDQLRELMARCHDKRAHHVLWVAQNGDVRIDPLPGDRTPVGFEAGTPDMKMRFETFAQGNDYVGFQAAHSEFAERLFKGLLKNWPDAIGKGGVHYVDRY